MRFRNVLLTFAASLTLAHPALAGPFAASNTEMGLDLLRKLDPTGTKNVFISPVSISSALLATANGARGSTLDGMRKVLHLREISIGAAAKEIKSDTATVTAPPGGGQKNSVTLTTANGLFIQKDYVLQKSFIASAAEQFNAAVESVDFKSDPKQAEKTINSWITGKTNGKIKNMVNNVDPNYRVVIANAIYFKGAWAKQFDASNTRPAPFHVTARNTIQVPTMNNTTELFYLKTPTLELLRMPYAYSPAEMVIVLPAANSSVEKTLKQLSGTSLPALARSATRKMVSIQLPKFKIEYLSSLKDSLKRMGMEQAFGDSADFSAMEGKSSEKLFVSDVLHKTFLDVDENGTEAAAATVVEMATRGMMIHLEPPVNFTVDRPFIVILRDGTTDMVYFLGAINDPRK